MRNWLKQHWTIVLEYTILLIIIALATWFMGHAKFTGRYPIT